MDDSVDGAAFDRVVVTPCLFQEYVDKQYEVRLTVIENRVFPVRLEPTDRHGTELVDWRRVASDPLYGDYVEPPAEVLAAAVQLMQRLSLLYGAFDFVVDTDGQWIFLEVNPVGQFMWIAEHLGLPMAEAMADLLGGGPGPADAPLDIVGYTLDPLPVDSVADE